MKATILFLCAFGAAILAFGSLAFAMSDPQPDFAATVDQSQHISLRQLETRNQQVGVFKSSVSVLEPVTEVEGTTFYGQRVNIAENNRIDKILVGVTSNLISRVEFWKNDSLVDVKELGFVGKTTRGQPHNLTVTFSDETNPKYNSKITMQFHSGSGFFGDIGVINLDLSPYGNLSGNKEISVFAKSLTTSSDAPHIEFGTLKIWKNFHSTD